MTTTRNSLMPGSFGQIAYRETWSGTGGSPTPTYGGTARGGGERRWLSYNHIGNVVNTSNDTGALVEAIDTDAYGNPLADVMTGAWASTLSERGLTTKELDPAAGMYYFYQRWYDPTTATFASRAPMRPYLEVAYGSTMNNPIHWIDTDGRQPAGGGVVLTRPELNRGWLMVDYAACSALAGMIGGAVGAGVGAVAGLPALGIGALPGAGIGLVVGATTGTIIGLAMCDQPPPCNKNNWCVASPIPRRCSHHCINVYGLRAGATARSCQATCVETLMMNPTNVRAYPCPSDGTFVR